MNQQEQAPILTTREAVEIVCRLSADFSGRFDPANRRYQAVKLLCELYGFKLEQFFDADGAKEG